MTTLARVDALRALPPPIALAVLRQLEAELGPEAVAALGAAWDFWRRPSQRFPTDAELRRYHTVVYAGDFGTGKTRCAWELLVWLIVTKRATGSRIVAATGASAREIVTDADTGILAWRKPGVTYTWESSKGYEGELTIDGTLVSLCSIEAPKSLTGSGRSAELLDDPPKWGANGKAALVNAMRSTRQPGALTIIPTTPDGLELIAEVNGTTVANLDAVGVLVIELGRTEDNANLDPKILAKRENLRRAGLWDPISGASPFAATPFADLRLDDCPPLVRLGIGLDPNKGGACEFGIVGGGIDARSCVHIRHDRSAALDDGINGWPAVAWNLAVELQREHPGAPWHFVLETNVGKRLAELLRGEERARRMRGDPVPLPGGGWASGRAEVSVCECEFIRAAKDKCDRAVSPARLAAQKQVRFAEDLRELEGQLRGLTPFGTKSDRADAAVHLINDLAGLGAQAVVETDHEAAFKGFAAAQERQPAPGWHGSAPLASAPEWDRV